MWKGIIFPTIIMGVTWLLISCSTTFYIFWLDQSYQRVFSENVAAIQAAGVVQETAWRILASTLIMESDTEAGTHRMSELVSSLESEMGALKELCLTSQERPLALRLEAQCLEYVRLVRQFELPAAVSERFQRNLSVRSLSDQTTQLAETAQQIRLINQQLLRDAANERESTNAGVLATRTSAHLVGQVLGIAYGWWMGRRLQRTVARITVTLRDATDGELPLGAVNVDQRQDLEAIHTQVEHVIARLRDANDELQRARHEILRSERLAAVGELAAGVAHELRNPLTSVKLLLQYVAQTDMAEPLTIPQLQVILEEIARMESTIQGLLDFSRPPKLKRSRCDIRDTLGRAVNLVLGRALHQNVKTSTELGETPLFVEGDAAQLHQVFVNLLLNGIEAMPHGGTLSIAASRIESGSTISIEFRDSGSGIDEAIQKRLFEPFVTTKDRGTGLGLAISRRIIDQHGGTIFAENDPHGGAIFRLTLPAV